MSNKLTSGQLDAWRALITAHARIICLIEQDLAVAKRVPLSYYDVLIELAEAPGKRLRMSELARSVVLSRSGLTRLVDKLEREGLLTREACATDGRGAYAVLTESGYEALRKAWPLYSAGIANYFVRHLKEEEVQAITSGLQRVLVALSQESEKLGSLQIIRSA